ncbi:zf-TFIIB domain-containing protein [Pseudooceanicola sp. CBS1P-1]|uniref:Transcription factor zinc-finger domain-containing protein n=1 Tax=Pseudooceanicola albus TaxID=2692189 RepID=A0A6L7G483_9RHOB|nr:MULTISPECIES: zf-TFIIB domain-containing protein [Pseudooceanicola]MBT9384534.1 zf-TFIIB domain-containing protein [Pseudooceanicola endophyticus]MXN18236.1 hypothetical protein [Pseudooceanicola albus]
MKCPVDGTPLLMTDRQGVEIDYCPQCRGVWLDRGELDKILDRSAAEQAHAQPQRRAAPTAEHGYRDERYDPRYRDKYAYKRKKKKSLLGELFDL